MASQMPNPIQGGWNHNGQTMQQNVETNEAGVQVRPMGLKVHYTFDKEAKVNCLARSTQTLFVQTIPLDEQNSIGIVDLRACLQAITECSPELGNQDSEGDYTIYALDYSEPDTPLVGQGMLSWALDSMRGGEWLSQSPKMVTGRVTKNLLAVFGGGNRETLEVKLKFTMPPHPMQPTPLRPAPLQPASLPPSRSAEMAVASGAAEWSSFIQANPHIGHTAHVSRVASPALSQGAPPPVTIERRDSIDPAISQANSGSDVQRIAPMPVPPSTTAASTSRPSSRSSRNRKPPTGRPRGRPRKKPAEGNTSGYEDGTEGEDGGSVPVKKRAKPMKVEKATPNPFTSGPESLRVTASTAGSLRNFRPVNANNEAVAGNHLQEVPRAPTPVPEGGPLNGPAQGGPKGVKPRRESSMRKELGATLSSQIPPRPLRALSPSQEDGRSPESPVETPAFSEDSPQDIRSSPPMPRTASFMRSSPPPSSPVLPPMPSLPRQISSFAENETDDLLDEPVLPTAKEGQTYSQPKTQKVMEDVDNTGIPTQVFRIEDGPEGQGLVHIQNFNTPYPTSTPAGPPPSEPVTAKKVAIPRLVRNSSQKRPAGSKQQPRSYAPTPPPTTDAAEKDSPVPTTASSLPDSTQMQGNQAMEAMEEDALFELVRAVSSSSEPNTSISTNQSTEGSLPTSKSSSRVIAPKPRPSRPLGRSQSAGILALPSVPASEPAGPSSLSQSVLAEPPRASTDTTTCLRRSKSVSVPKPIAASDPLGPPETYLITNTLPTLSEAIFPQSDFPPMPSSPPCKSNKNQIKKDSIKQRLESAIAAGEMPPFCTNCGAIETPTWRKIWVQEHDGVPENVEYSEKPGRVTAIEILKRDKDKNPLSHRLIKKALGFDDDRSDWSEKLLCNPCEAFPVTDSIGPVERSSPKQPDVVSMGSRVDEDAAMQNVFHLLAADGRHTKNMSQWTLMMNWEALDACFSPSPRKEGTPKTLGEIDANVTKTADCRQNKEICGKENAVCDAQNEDLIMDDDIEALFNSPVRPSTPPPKSKADADSALFKTPTRPTPSHRPITRSVSRSLRSVRDLLSPSQQALLQRTPTRSPASVRRSPRLNLESKLESVLDTPLSRTITQLLSEPNFDLASSNLDFSTLPLLDTDPASLGDFGSFLSTDGIAPSSSPKDVHVNFAYGGSDNVWAEWGGIEHKSTVQEKEK
ncbi:Zinc finger, NHR/GATA-type [Fusarium oxysporum f. sp. vasinfectum]|nr:Zinc finger, NHR/GATA-type [Fusarium oxysporum f. sp. vasinfectum]